MTHAGHPQAEESRRSEHSTPGPLLCETVHAGRTNDQTSLQAKFPSLPNHLLAVQTAEPRPLPAAPRAISIRRPSTNSRGVLGFISLSPCFKIHHARRNGPSDGMMRGPVLGAGSPLIRAGWVMMRWANARSLLTRSMAALVSGPDLACCGMGTTLPSTIWLPGRSGLPS